MVIGVIVARGFPEPQLVEQTLRLGKIKNPGAVWVVKKGDALTRGFLDRAVLDYVELPTMDRKTDRYAHYDAALVTHHRDMEMKTCDILLVFQKTGATNYWTQSRKTQRDLNVLIGRDENHRARPDRGMFIIERGPAPAKRRAARRKPVGV